MDVLVGGGNVGLSLLLPFSSKALCLLTSRSLCTGSVSLSSISRFTHLRGFAQSVITTKSLIGNNTQSKRKSGKASQPPADTHSSSSLRTFSKPATRRVEALSATISLDCCFDLGYTAHRSTTAPLSRLEHTNTAAAMAGVRDPAFWKRFSYAVHMDEENAQRGDLKHRYITNFRSPFNYNTPANHHRAAVNPGSHVSNRRRTDAHASAGSSGSCSLPSSPEPSSR